MKIISGLVLVLGLTNAVFRSPDAIPRLVAEQEEPSEPSRHAICANRRCCNFRRPLDEIRRKAEDGVNCRALTIEECTGSHDNYCIWNCDENPLHRNGDKRPGVNAGYFVGFKEGRGIIETYPNENGEEPSEPQFADEGLTGYQEFSDCGDVYEYDIDEEERVRLQNDNSPVGGVRGGGDLDIDLEEDLSLNELNERRRMTILGDDGRIHSTGNVFKIGVLINDDGGICTASLISRRVIVTSAGCLYDTINNDWNGGWTFYPNTQSGSLSSGYRVCHASVPNNWVSLTSFTSSLNFIYDVGIARLCTTNTNLGWLGFGYNTALGNPVSLISFGYPSDKSQYTRWYQNCDYNGAVNSDIFYSNNCDLWGQAGQPSINNANGAILGIASRGQATYNIYARFNAAKVSWMCNYIASGETATC